MFGLTHPSPEICSHPSRGKGKGLIASRYAAVLLLAGIALSGFAIQPPKPDLIGPQNGATNVNPHNVTFSWAISNDYYTPFVTYHEVGTSWYPQTPGYWSGRTYTTTLRPNTTYEWQVAATDRWRANANSSDWYTWSEIWTFTTGRAGGSSQICTPNFVDIQDCTTDAGCPGLRTRTCSADGTSWGEWGVCNDKADDNCPSAEVPYADSFQFPLTGSWNVRCNGYWGECVKKWHLAEDVGREAGTTVYAPAAGIVKHTRVRSAYGHVVIIESRLRTETVSIVLGHLRSNLLVRVGDVVSKGQAIGYLGDRSENGGYDPHIHFGIRKGPYAGDSALACYGEWAYSGYASDPCARDDWYVPSAFVIAHSAYACY